MTLFLPFQFIRDGFDWAGRSGRISVIIAFLIFPGLVFVAGAVPAFELLRAAIFAFLGVMVVPCLGHVRRRLRDLGRSGWWGLLAFGPLVAILIPDLVFKRGRDDIVPEPIKSRWLKLGFMASVALAVLLFSRAFWEPYTIPSGSMKPALMVGDYIAVSRAFGNPERGQVLVFRHPVFDLDYVMRLVGMPGDLVKVRDGVLLLNEEPVGLKDDGNFEEVFVRQGAQGSYPRCENAPVGEGGICLKSRQVETLPNGTEYAILNIGNQNMDYTGAYKVPKGYYFFMGDNRDNSNDSRIPQSAGGLGFVPAENILGRVRLVVFSRTGEPNRILKGIK